MRRRSALLFVLLTFMSPLVGTRTAMADELIDLDLYGRLLEAHTKEVPSAVGTAVDYRGLRDAKDWRTLVRQVEDARPAGALRAERLAFWINAYNILTIDLILKHYPVEGIRKIGSFFSPVWDIEVATIEGQTLSLGQIEHDILRKMDEPRIHAAIVCASISCPPLARTPFRAESLDADLSAAMRSWLSNRKKGLAIERENRVVRLSKIFDWFEKDFEASGGVLATIAEYADGTDAAWIRENGRRARIRYFDYDWSLNDLR